MNNTSKALVVLVSMGFLSALPVQAYAQAFKKSAVSYKDESGADIGPAITIAGGRVRVTLGQQGGNAENRAYAVRLEGKNGGNYKFGNSGIYPVPPGTYTVQVEGYLSLRGMPARIEAKVDYD